jgi:CheY-like chemotaxis protein
VSLTEDLAWLKDAPPENPADLAAELPRVLRLAQSLAAQRSVQLDCALSGEQPLLAIDPIALRQALLSLLSVAISRASPGSRVQIRARRRAWEAEIRVETSEPTALGPETTSGDDSARLQVARQLAEFCGGDLNVAPEGEPLRWTLTIPALGQLPVLAIDDNAGTLHLLKRYTAGTRYRLVGTRDPEHAAELAQTLAPQVIVLDVMMPHVDGWEVLGRLHQHPATAHIPVIVCTILPQEELALSLGAAAFVRKPVSRQAFLAALNEQLARSETTPH